MLDNNIFVRFSPLLPKCSNPVCSQNEFSSSHPPGTTLLLLLPQLVNARNNEGEEARDGVRERTPSHPWGLKLLLLVALSALPQSSPEYAFFFADCGGVQGTICPVTKECLRLEVPPLVLEKEFDRECIAECGGKISAASSGGRGDTGGVSTPPETFFEDAEPETLDAIL